MAHQVKACTDSVEDPSSSPSTMTDDLQLSVTPGDPMPSSGPCGHQHPGGTHSHAHTHTLNTNSNKKGDFVQRNMEGKRIKVLSLTCA